MTYFKGILAVFLTLFAIPSQSRAEPETSITLQSFSDSLKDLAPWIKPAESFLVKATGPLALERTEPNGIQIYHADENQWFETDFSKLRETFRAKDDLEAKEKLFDTFSFDQKTASFLIPYARLSYWDILPHPPVFKLSDNLASHSIKYGSPRVINPELLTQAYQKELDALTRTEATLNNSVSLRRNHEVFDELVKQVKSTKRYIFASNMFLACDPSVEPLIDAVAERIQNGVQVYQIVERVFAFEYGKCFKRLKKLGVNMIYSDQMIRLFHRTVYHNKFWVFDGETAVVYGLNLIDSEVDGTGFNQMYHDTGLFVRGPMVRDLGTGFGDLVSYIKPRKPKLIQPYLDELNQQKVAERAAHVRGSDSLNSDASKPAPQGLCRAVFQGPETDRHLLTDFYENLIDHARKTVYLSMIRLPGTWEAEGQRVEAVLKRLIEKSKLDPNFSTDILNNNYIGSTDVKSTDYKKSSLLTKLYTLFVRGGDHRKNVQESRDLLRPVVPPEFRVWDYFQFSHQKTMMIDRTLTLVGSYNLNKISTDTSFEMAAMCYDDSLNTQMEQLIIQDLLNSIPVLRGK